jgi:uncharacterized metal-binding protein YceD (DUF177 family)
MNHPTNEEPQAPPLTRKIRVSEIADNADASVSVTEAERASIAGLLELMALNALDFDYRLRRGGGGRVHLSGRLTADATQTCVVTLEPVPASIDVPVAVEFWPETLIEDLEKKAEDPSQSGLIDWPEPITDDTIDLGPVVYESFATALDPYPKKEGASFEWSQGASASEDRESGPFAALKQLKKP